MVSTTPSNNYVVGRVRRNLLRNSFVGVLVTSRDSTVAGRLQPRLRNRCLLRTGQVAVQRLSPAKRHARQSRARNQARKLGVAWQDDELCCPTEYNAVQENFNPEVGFLRRSNITQYTGDVAWTAAVDDEPDDSKSRFGRQPRLLRRRKRRHRDENRGRQFRHRVREQRVHQLRGQSDVRQAGRGHADPSAIVPAGDYKYLAQTASFSTNQSRKISGSGNVSWGEFWNGDRTSFGGGLGFTPNYHLNLDLTYSRNDVTLPTGSFTTDLVGMRLVYAFTGRASVNAFVQYNADTHQVSSNIRFNFIHHPLSDLYLVYNDRRDTTERPAHGALVHRQGDEPVRFLARGATGRSRGWHRLRASGCGRLQARTFGLQAPGLRTCAKKNGEPQD